MRHEHGSKALALKWSRTPRAADCRWSRHSCIPAPVLHLATVFFHQSGGLSAVPYEHPTSKPPAAQPSSSPMH